MADFQQMNMKEQLLNFASQIFQGGAAFNVFSTLVAVLSIVLMIYFYFKSLSKRKPVYLVRNINLIKNGVDRFKAVSVRYEDKQVVNLSVARIAFWNDGRETINKSDVAEKDPVRLVAAAGIQILDTEIITQNELTNSFQVSLNSKKQYASILFDFFDKNQGIVLQVLHTGTSSDDLLINGTIKGFGSIKKGENGPVVLKWMDYLKIPARLKPRHKQIIVGIFSLMMVVILWITELSTNLMSEPRNPKITWALLMIITIAYGWMGLSMLLQKVPKGLSLFYDEPV